VGKNIGISRNFPNRTPIAQQLRERIDKWNYMKLKSFCIPKEMVTNLKKKPIEWEKICQPYT
jgi:hypothetical protein